MSSMEGAVSAESTTPAYPGAVSTEELASLQGASAGQSQLQRNLRRFLIGNKLNLVGLVIVIVFFSGIVESSSRHPM